MRVAYSTTIAAAIDTAEEEYQNVPTVAALIKAIAARHGERVEGCVGGADGRLLPSVFVAVNDRRVDSLDHPLKETDDIFVLSAIGGG